MVNKDRVMGIDRLKLRKIEIDRENTKVVDNRTKHLLALSGISTQSSSHTGGRNTV